jgi:hypothetical protein
MKFNWPETKLADFDAWLDDLRRVNPELDENGIREVVSRIVAYLSATLKAI